MASQDDTVAATLEAMAQDAFAVGLGMQVEELRLGYCRTSVTVEPHMLNVHGVPHGGLLFTLADYAFAGACNSHGRLALALNVTISYLDTVQVGTRLIAEATEEHLGRRTGLYLMTVTDQTGKLVASCRGIAYRKNVWFAGGPEETD
jgi:acyl-CoA thioesterase